MHHTVTSLQQQEQQGSQVQVDDRSGTARAHPDTKNTLQDGGTSAKQQQQQGSQVQVDDRSGIAIGTLRTP